jgi:hypothetical protein
MALAVEPLLVLGGPGTRLLDDGWTVVTEDGSRPPTSSTRWRSPRTGRGCSRPPMEAEMASPGWHQLPPRELARSNS